MRKIINYSVIAFFFCFFLVSCSSDSIYENKIEFPNQSWQRIEAGKDIKFDKIKIKSIKDSYDINVSFYHTPNINVDEISFVLRIISPSGMKKETIHTIKLKDRDGKKFIGKNTGDIIEVKEPIKQYVFFPEQGDYTIMISNYCEKFQVDGLVNIGLEVKKSNLDYEIEK